MILAVTGGTGFVGRHLLDLAVGRGFGVRALARQPQPPRNGIDWIAGALDAPAALETLVGGADAVIHVAGITSAPDLATFERGNVAGTQAIVDAARAAGVRRFVHVSSLAAREPQLSMYGASKADAEQIVAKSGFEWAMVRPPAIYGPGELRDLFRMAARGFVLLPPGGHLSIIGVVDLCRLLLALTENGAPSGIIYEPDDGQPGGWEQRAMARALGTAVGRQIVPVVMPRWALSIAAAVDRAARGSNAQLTPDRVRYFSHPDWTIDPARRPPAALWVPETPTETGLAETAAWYRANGLL